MKSSVSPQLCACVLLLASSLTSPAATNTWTNGTSNLIWDVGTSANWTAPTTWANGDDAIFGATGAGSITLGAGVTANSLTFNSTGYTLSGSSLGLTGPFITTATGVQTTISSALTGSAGLTKAGAGNLILTGLNSYTGTTTITNGALFASAASGAALPGAVTLGDGTNKVYLIATTANQLASGTVLNFANGALDAKFELRGTNQTVGGLNSAAGAALSIIQNSEATSPNSTTPGAATLTINNATNQSFTGLIRNSLGGALSIVKEGTGTQELKNISAASMGYTGDTTINNGRLTLNLSGAGNGFSSNVVVNSGGSLGLDGTFNMGTVISGAGPVVKVGTGTVTSTGATANTYTGVTTVQDGTLVLAKTAGVNAIVGNVTIGDAAGNDVLRIGANEQIANNSVLTFISGPAGGNGGKLEIQNFTETVGGLSSAGGVSLIQANESGGSGTGTLIVNNSADYTFDGIIRNGGAGALALTKTGAGRQIILESTTVTGNSYTGQTTVSGGVLQFGNSTATRTATGSGPLQIDAAGNALLYYSNAQTFNNTVTGTGKLDYRSMNSAATPSSNEFIVGGANTGFSGPITATDTRLRVTSPGNLGDGSATNTITTIGNGQVMYNGAGTYNNNVSISGLGWYEVGGVLRHGALRLEQGAIQAGKVTMTANSGIGSQDAGAGGTISGVISDGGNGFSMTKLGSNTVTLTNANTYSGKTFVQVGTLALSGTGSIATSSGVDLTAGATFDVSATTATWALLSPQTLSGTGIVKGNFNVSGTLAPGNSAGAITTTSAVTLNSGSIWREELGGTATTAYDQLIGSGVNSLTSNVNIIVSLINAFTPSVGDSFVLAPGFGTRTGSPTFDFSGASAPSGASWDTSTFNIDGRITLVPEASSLMLVGLALFGGVRRRR